MVRIVSNRSNSIDAELVLAADQFLIEPANRDADEKSTTESPRSIIAGYPWFTDWGHDTMISLPGLTLTTGQTDDARRILLTFADYVRDGLIPNLFPEGGQTGMYHTADATLWFVQAIAAYQQETGDENLIKQLFPKLSEIVNRHIDGTHYGIHLDKTDGLLVQGADNVQLTWMDAKAGDWVVTPRRGKAVEINALWFNALSHYIHWNQTFDGPSDSRALQSLAAQCYESFNRRFWNDATGCLRDVVDSPDEHDNAIRPNQLFAISLDHAVLMPVR